MGKVEDFEDVVLAVQVGDLEGDCGGGQLLEGAALTTRLFHPFQTSQVELDKPESNSKSSQSGCCQYEKRTKNPTGGMNL